ncbi:trehalose synthase [Nocardioides ginsengisegetis]|uniref:Trehalose synthase n=1 Tax=Nocardioides ginsengisegetis TaxID=661491 RepID=A0A7W3PB25_9ACTN|nr:trehalose synthase [Nocardioides ginsengisegetis]
MHEIQIAPADVDRLTGLLSRERKDQFDAVAAGARELLGGRVVWNVNATAHGGGVAEMLQTLLANARGVGIDTRWLVLSGSPEFFAITKRLHNVLHGEPGDGGELGAAEHAVVAEALRPDLADMATLVKPDDVVLLHDPQTAAMVTPLRETGAKVVWRCHIGRDTPNALTDLGWAFLRPLIEAADAFVFSRRNYVPRWMASEKVHIITPSIDPFSAKNAPLSDADAEATLGYAGLLGGARDPRALTFTKRNGTVGTTRPHRGLDLTGGTIPCEARLVVQISRWDRLKDMTGVMQGFADAGLPGDVHLLLVGPEVSGVSDDPEGAGVLAECRSRWDGLAREEQSRVHLVCLSMDDVDENAHLVNALQRRASVVVQKSLVEGFGLTVTEAMWKARPVVASAIGGIQDQIVDGENGLLLEDPHDLDALGRALARLLEQPDLAAGLGNAARATVHERFLGDRHLEAYADLFGTLLV